MGNFRKDSGGRFGGRGGFGGGRDRGPVTMHQATCDKCGESCEVPFRPTGDKPVYCSACFGNKKEIGNNRGGDRSSQRDSSNYRAPAKPDFGSNRSDISRGNNDEVKRQLEILNGKMDLLIRAIENIANTKPLVVKEKIKKATKTAPIVKTKKK